MNHQIYAISVMFIVFYSHEFNVCACTNAFDAMRESES